MSSSCPSDAAVAATTASSPRLPLVVDLDGTLTAADTLVESIVDILRRKPLAIFVLLYRLVFGGGRSALKHQLATYAKLQTDALPWRADVLAWLRTEHASGRRIILATAAHESIATSVARHVGLFDAVLSSTATLNLKGRHKLAAIQEEIGKDFVYVGDSRADLAVWRGARAAVLVSASPAVTRKVHQMCVVEKEFVYPGPSINTWMRGLRLHQWVKNILLFVPLCAGFEFTSWVKVLHVLLGFLAFSLVASATYVLNDLWDLFSDRKHPRKRFRPFASGQIPLLHGVAASVALCATGLALAFVIAPRFGAMVAGYVVLTLAYSWALKGYVLIDVIMLAMLYTYRVLAGAVVADMVVTPWLLAFSLFLFLSLALVKRCAELKSLFETDRQATHGRDYNIGDLTILWPLGVCAGLCSVVVFGLYIGTPGAAEQYANTHILWLVGVGLLYWIARLWIKTARGEMHDDPIVFAMRDYGCRVTTFCMIALTGVAHFLK